MTAVSAYIGLGSNLGDREATLRGALHAVAELHATDLVQVSRIIETPPMGQPGQSPYLNAAAHLSTHLAARELLQQFLRIEASYGRTRNDHARWGPRELDIDLLLFGDQVIDVPGLTVPHAHMHERLFVLEPLAQIAPDVSHPVLHTSIKELLERLTQNS